VPVIADGTEKEERVSVLVVGAGEADAESRATRHTACQDV
jgi:hypothetical protein